MRPGGAREGGDGSLAGVLPSSLGKMVRALKTCGAVISAPTGSSAQSKDFCRVDLALVSLPWFSTTALKCTWGIWGLGSTGGLIPRKTRKNASGRMTGHQNFLLGMYKFARIMDLYAATGL